jgi:hypothetical protein
MPRFALVAGILARQPAALPGAGSAQGDREHSTGEFDAPGASQATESCKQQSSSAAAGTLAAAPGQIEPRVCGVADDRFHRPPVAELTIGLATKRAPGSAGVSGRDDDRVRPIPSAVVAAR